MVTITAFLRHSPKPLLEEYFHRIGLGAEAAAIGKAHPKQPTAKLVAMVQQLDEQLQSRVMNEGERICAMSDEPGETALYCVSRSREQLNELPSRYARALWAFLDEPEAFKYAEQASHADGKRNGRMWDGFVGQPGLEVALTDEPRTAFEEAVAEVLDSKRVLVEICTRSRPGRNQSRLVQATVYVEGRANAVLSFVGRDLARRPLRPVIEAAVTYEPATGTIEVVASVGTTRTMLAKLFAEHLLASPVAGARLQLRKFSLAGLRQPHSFPSDAEDQIEAVRIDRLRLMPIETQAERITLECLGGHRTKTIWQASAERFGPYDPLKGGCRITQAHLTIRFLPQAGVRGRTLPITITMPVGCDLKDRTHRERVVGEKYLTRWGLLQDV